MTESKEFQADPLHPQRLTWAALLGRWVDFAKASVALPAVGDSGLLRESIVDIITIQAVWMSLQDFDELAADQRRLGLDRAGILLQKHGASLRHRWGSHMPAELGELLSEARHTWEVAAARSNDSTQGAPTP